MCNCNQNVQVRDCPDPSCCWKLFSALFGKPTPLSPESRTLIEKYLKMIDALDPQQMKERYELENELVWELMG